MSAPNPYVPAILASVEVGPSSRTILAHALAAAVVRRAQLFIFHSGPREDWRKLPGVRSILEDWKLLSPGAPKDAVFDELGVRVEKIMSRSSAPDEALREFVAGHQPDLLVVGSAGRSGLRRAAKPSVAARVARVSRTSTLFIPEGSSGLVDAATGRLALEHILVPVAAEPAPAVALQAAVRVAEAYGEPPVAATILHAGKVFPPLDERGLGETCTWKREIIGGSPPEAIGKRARAVGADLIVMASAGRSGLVDSLRGSVTERVVRHAPCPVLAVPPADV